MKRIVLVLAAVLVVAPRAWAQEMPADYAGVLKTLNRQGDYKDNTLKVNIPRNDLKVVVDGVATPTPFGFGGWVAMTKGTGGMDVMMGDLVLTEDEVNPVMSALLTNGLDVTALHNHFLFDTPRIFYMHVHGHGSAADLATKVKPALALIGAHPPAASAAASGQAINGMLDTAALARIVGSASINARMGLNTWAAFYGNDNEAVIAGDVAMLDREVEPVLKSLRSNGIDVVAIHQHMTGTQPQVIFLHYWGKGPAQKLATAFRNAIDQTGARPKTTTAQR
jgi:hypothetical protein